MATTWRWMLSGALVLSAAGAAESLSPPPPITAVRPVPIHDGVNDIPGFMPDGGSATIVQAWRENGNAHGHYTWMVLGGRKGAGLVSFVAFPRDPASGGDTIGASPFDGERVTGDVRLVTASIEGKRVSLAIKGVLDWPPSGIIADHATAVIRWYRLVHLGEQVGGAPDSFEPIGAVRTTKRYCNVDLALRDAAGVTLPADFAGANRVDGCFPG